MKLNRCIFNYHYSMSRTNQKPITEPSLNMLCNILLWTILDGGGKILVFYNPGQENMKII